MSNDTLEQALWYAQQGWRVLPLYGISEGHVDGGAIARCLCGKPNCQSRGKHPRTANGVKDATTTPAVIRAWYSQWPDCNLGVATGAESGLVVLDVDPRHGGDDSLRALERAHGKLPETPQSITGGGGKHILFAHPGGRVSNKVGILPGLDIRGDGGYIVAPPSRHAGGSRYEWELICHPEEVPPAPMPEWLSRLVGNNRPATVHRLPSIIPDGERHATLVSLAGTMRRRGMTQDAIGAALMSENTARCSPPLGADEVRNIAASIAQYPAAHTPRYAVYNTRPVPVWEQQEPDERRWVIEGLVPDGALTILYGDGGHGKSLLAVYIATLVCQGRSFLGRMVEKRGALYVDAELEQSEMVRRAYWVARGMGLDHPPPNLYYYRLPGSLSDPSVQQAALTAVRECGAGFCILDSLTIGSHGADPTAAGDMTAVMKAVEEWGAVVAIDHVPKPALGVNLSHYRPFGSAFKYNLARSVVQLTRAEGGALTLRQSKSNFGRLADPLHLALEFTQVEQCGNAGSGRGVGIMAQAVRFQAIGPDDPRLAGVEDNLPAIERVYRALSEYGAKGTTPETLAEPLEMAAKTVRNHLSALRQQGRALPKGDSTWLAA